MDHLDLCSRLRNLCIALLVFAGQVVFPPRVEAQTAPATGQQPAARFDLEGRTVQDVRVLGNTTVSTPVILNVVRTRSGQPYDPQTVQEDYQRIYAQGAFSNVEAKVEPTDTGGVIVVFIVSEQKQIRSIAYRGNAAIDTEAIQQVVDVTEGEAINRFQIALARQAVERLYKERNYPFAHVTVDAESLAQRGELIFNIVEGPNVRIRNIDFIGATSFTESRLKSQIQSKSWIFIFRPGTLDLEQVDDDVAAVRRYYNEKGFFDARVGRRLNWSPDMREVEIEFLIDEGQRYVVDRVTFRGNVNISEAELREQIKLLEGVTFDQELLQRDVRQIVRAYSPFGYIYQPQSDDPDYLRIRPSTIPRYEPGRVELVYDISEGRSFRVGRIIPKGNVKTQDKVVLREMRLAPGELYNSGAVQDAVDRLRATGFFTRVSATPIGSDRMTRDLLVEVEEGRTATFNIGAGINSNGGVGGNITYEQRNFDIMNWPLSWRDLFSGQAFTGAGQTFRASFEPGTRITNAYVRFTEPWIFDQPYSFTGEAYLRNRIREDYVDQRIGGRVSFGKRFNQTWSGAISLRGEAIEISDIEEEEIRAFEILDLQGDSWLSGLGVRVTRDTTVRGLLPARGMTTTAGAEAVGALGGDYDFQRLNVSHSQYFTLSEDLLDRKVILALHGDAGYIIGDAPFFERFYAGGLGSVRGFAFRGISPRSGPADDRVGGDFSLTGTAELSFPLAGEELRGVVFTDFGTVEEDFEFGTIRTAVGAGIRLTLPVLGQIPIAIDFAVPLTTDDDDDTQIFSFSLGLIQ